MGLGMDAVNLRIEPRPNRQARTGQAKRTAEKVIQGNAILIGDNSREGRSQNTAIFLEQMLVKIGRAVIVKGQNARQFGGRALRLQHPGPRASTVAGRPGNLLPVDAIDPSVAPGTGTPEIGGLTTREAEQLIRLLDGLKLVGAEVVEVSPPFDLTAMSSIAGATVMFELMCILARQAFKQ